MEKDVIIKPVTGIENEKFVVYSHITASNSRLVLNKEEAALMYIELHKFLEFDKVKPRKNLSKIETDTRTIKTCMGIMRNNSDKLTYLTKEQQEEFDNIGYTGKNNKGKRVSREDYLNSLKIGKFTVQQTVFDNGSFSEEFIITRGYKIK